ncbi:MAG: dihydroxyacetone kinase subunit DhaK [Spirochaetales bacterium]|nr:dihydroxyacetone kinase subunit DhaK [Spirochaetales bacterium]
MKKFINKPENFVDEMLEGILEAHPDQLTFCGNSKRNIVRTKCKDKVGLVTGGGSGHLPLFMGYVGDGLLDGTAVGGVFQSPSAEQILEITKHIDNKKGVVYIYGNYSGDIMNFEMAAEMAEMENIKTAQVIGNDDVASAPKGEEQKRRGVAGIFYLYKCAGAAAEEGANLEEVTRIANKAKASVRTMGVALSPCIIPEVGKASFSIGDDEMEIGMGIHGEPGIKRTKLQEADQIVDQMVEPILRDLSLEQNEEVSILVNGLGATPKEELYIVYRRISKILKEKNITVFNVYAGEFATSMEMTGFSISICKLDTELKRLLSKNARTPFFEQIDLNE